MYDGELSDVKADEERYARAGFDFMLTEFPGWFHPVPIDGLHPGDSGSCALAWAGRPEGKGYYAVVDDLRVKYPGLITSQWLFEHGFLDGTWIKNPDATPRHGYHLLSDAWRELVSYAQVVRQHEPPL